MERTGITGDVPVSEPHTDRPWTLADQKLKARHIVYLAVERGELVRGECARVADGDCRGITHAHHPDYYDPKTVVWLCRRHHDREHRKTR